MQTHRRPPREMSPDDFFISWLPAELARLGAASRLGEMVARVQLEGEEGGSWDLCAHAGQVEVGQARPERRPLVTLILSVQDFRAIVAGEEGPIDLSPPAASPTDLLFVDMASQQLLALVSGTYRFEVHGYNGRTWVLTAVLGDGAPVDPPTATLATDAETYAAILARTLPAPDAYFAGKITITGDVGRGMQVALGLLPKL